MDVMAEVKKVVDEATAKLKSDPELLKKFQKDPVKTLEGITGIDLPDDKIQGVVDAIKAKLAAGGVADKLGSLFK